MLIKQLLDAKYFGCSFFFSPSSSSSSTSCTAVYCGHCLPIQSLSTHSGLWLLYGNFLSPLSSNPLQFKPSRFYVVFLFSRSFHSGNQYLFWHFSLFVFSVCLRHINDFINFTLSLHKRECKIYVIYILFIIILRVFSFLWEYKAFL